MCESEFSVGLFFFRVKIEQRGRWWRALVTKKHAVCILYVKIGPQSVSAFEMDTQKMTPNDVTKTSETAKLGYLMVLTRLTEIFAQHRVQIWLGLGANRFRVINFAHVRHFNENDTT